MMGDNMSFEDIPEDTKESYPCPKCDTGSITIKIEIALWACDNCDYTCTFIDKAGKK